MSIPFLKHGDTIAIAAPSRKIGDLDCKPFEKFLNDFGFNVIYAENISCEQNQFAGTDNERADAINKLFEDPAVKAIISARGGYGAVRIVDKLKWEALSKNPKWLCGFSDFTVLLNHQYQCNKLPSVHSDMALRFLDTSNRENFTTLVNILSGNKQTISFSKHELNRGEKASGVIVGGNLSVLYSMLGSKSFPELRNKILFIEDLDEYLYHIDRMMYGLKRAGVFDNLNAVVIGSMSDMRDNDVPFGKTAYEIISDCLKDFSFPLFFDFPAGHTNQNLPFFIGKDTVLETHKDKIIFNQD
ncbi:MAG: LD-carboxypeptidase [Bacteroidales bacterium]|nr:LD-carboxypeptidase [Bacteroidales bacterium]